jgi:hypothetical protein
MESENTKICPTASVWNSVYKTMVKNAEENGLPMPPIPLILAGWVFSNDREKKQRWVDTVTYATKHGCTHLYEHLSDASFYFAHLS